MAALGCLGATNGQVGEIVILMNVTDQTR